MPLAPMASRFFAVSIRVSPFTALLAEAVMELTDAESIFAAVSKDVLVRVLGSEKSAVIIFPDSAGAVLMGRDRISFIDSAVSRIRLISESGSSLSPRRSLDFNAMLIFTLRYYIIDKGVMKILALNCGSSSVKYQLYDWSKKEVICKGIAERIGASNGFLSHKNNGDSDLRIEASFADHGAALSRILGLLTDEKEGAIKDIKDISAVGHRVLHGGAIFNKSCLIDDKALEDIKSLKDLGPLHMPPNIAGIEAARKTLPGVPNIAVFDTAFHQTMHPRSYLYAVPYEWYKMYGVRKYGFHGSSHLYVSKRASVLLKKKNSDTNVITLHIGNGVSAAAIKNGVCIDTTMGLTPLAGAVMGTRSGDIDPAIILFMIEKEGFHAHELDRILNNKSGLLGITGKYSDRRDIDVAAAEGSERCVLAQGMEAYRLKKYIGSYVAAIGCVDAVVFTGGAGELNPALRERVLEGLDCIGISVDKEKNLATRSSDKETEISVPDSKIKAYVIPTNEELVFIEDVVAILENRYDVHTNFTYSFESPDYRIG